MAPGALTVLAPLVDRFLHEIRGSWETIRGRDLGDKIQELALLLPLAALEVEGQVDRFLWAAACRPASPPDPEEAFEPSCAYAASCARNASHPAQPCSLCGDGERNNGSDRTLAQSSQQRGTHSHLTLVRT